MNDSYNKELVPSNSIVEKKENALALFSGGKDCVYSMQKALDYYNIIFMTSIIDGSGNLQLTDGIETDRILRRAQHLLFNIPNVDFALLIKNNSASESMLNLCKMIEIFAHSYKCNTIITGDLWHKDGIDKIIQKHTNLKVFSSSLKKCPDPKAATDYLINIIHLGIEAVISGVRNSDLPEDFIGRKLNLDLIKDLKQYPIDITGENAEYQTFVTNAPMTKRSMSIKSFDTEKVSGMDLQGHTYTRMKNVTYHIDTK